MAVERTTSRGVHLQGVTKRYGDVLALDHVDLDIQTGEFVGLLGPNGAGKTTAISLMLGLRRPDSGSVRLLGANPIDSVARRRSVADSSRRRVLDLILAYGEVTPTALAAELPLTRQADAKHLAVLDRAGLVEGRRTGRKSAIWCAPSTSTSPLAQWPRSPHAGTSGSRRLRALPKRALAQQERRKTAQLGGTPKAPHGPDSCVRDPEAAWGHPTARGPAEGRRKSVTSL
jgi:ABC-type cobalamin/Fe3+-siderophores transport system ATPase subunit